MRVQLTARLGGEGGATVVLLHGFGGHNAIWTGLEAALGAGFSTIAYDLPGHGGSFAYPGAGPAKVAARAVLADLAGRGAGPVHLVGHSMGGAVAILAALADPARVASLTLMAPGGIGPEINDALLSRFAMARDAATLRACLQAMSGAAHAPADADVMALAEARAGTGCTDFLVSLVGGIAAGGRQGVIPRASLDRISVPVTVAWGSEDSVLPFAHADLLPPAFRVCRVQGAGHMLPEEEPALMAGLVRKTAARRV